MKKFGLLTALLVCSVLLVGCNSSQNDLESIEECTSGGDTCELPEIIDEPTDNYSCSNSEDQYSCDTTETNEVQEMDVETLETNATNVLDKLGGLDPEVALEYMQETDDLVIIDTRDITEYPNGFDGSLRIPWNQIANRVSEIPEGSKVLLHCGGGNVAPKAYKELLYINPNLEQLGYIAGTPLFDEYNNWLNS